MSLSKAEIRAIKKGKAYKSFVKVRLTAWAILLLWVIFAIPLAHINNITFVIYALVSLGLLFVSLYFIKGYCWRCHSCKSKLPTKEQISTQSFTVPLLVKTCPHCNADLTE